MREINDLDFRICVDGRTARRAKQQAAAEPFNANLFRYAYSHPHAVPEACSVIDVEVNSMNSSHTCFKFRSPGRQAGSTGDECAMLFNTRRKADAGMQTIVCLSLSASDTSSVQQILFC